MTPNPKPSSQGEKRDSRGQYPAAEAAQALRDVLLQLAELGRRARDETRERQGATNGR